jgi:hypothetical protein
VSKVTYGSTPPALAILAAVEAGAPRVECNYFVLHAYFLTIFRKYDFAAYFCVPL